MHFGIKDQYYSVLQEICELRVHLQTQKKPTHFLLRAAFLIIRLDISGVLCELSVVKEVFEEAPKFKFSGPPMLKLYPCPGTAPEGGAGVEPALCPNWNVGGGCC